MVLDLSQLNTVVSWHSHTHSQATATAKPQPSHSKHLDCHTNNCNVLMWCAFQEVQCLIALRAGHVLPYFIIAPYTLRAAHACMRVCMYVLYAGGGC